MSFQPTYGNSSQYHLPLQSSSSTHTFRRPTPLSTSSHVQQQQQQPLQGLQHHPPPLKVHQQPHQAEEGRPESSEFENEIACGMDALDDILDVVDGAAVADPGTTLLNKLWYWR